LIYIFLFLSILFCYIRFIYIDPIKRRFFLVFTLLITMPLVSFFSYVWFSYFICLLFLSGIFVIIVYFSSLSKFFYFKHSFSFIILFLSLIYFTPIGLYYYGSISINNFYYRIYFLIFF
uniref:NADH dehydrogenase subunit 2 n=1 Tax=Rhabditophanes sp. KR3021 TaxID=114890 RepID=A0AC35UHM9_9BILA